MKICAKCKVEKNESDFGTRQIRRKGAWRPKSRCNDCARVDSRERARHRRKENPSKEREKLAKWRLKNPGQTRAQGRGWYAKNKAGRAATQRECYYGITKEQFGLMLLGQNNCCAVCGDEFSKVKIKGGPHVDHDHSLGKVRGLLCHNCNTGLGHFKDSPTLIAKAIAYLEKVS